MGTFKVGCGDQGPHPEMGVYCGYRIIGRKIRRKKGGGGGLNGEHGKDNEYDNDYD